MRPSYISTLSHDPAVLDELRPEWTELLSNSASPGIFMTWEWVSNWWSYFGQDEKLWLIQVRDNEHRLVGVAPLMCTKAKPVPIGGRLSEVIAWRQIQFIGAHTAADHLDFIVDRGNEREILRSIFDVLTQRSNEWDTLMLSNMSSNSATVRMIRQHNISWRESSPDVCPVVHLPKKWDDFFMSLSRRKRKEQRRFQRQLNEAFGDRWTYRIVDTSEEVKRTLEALIGFHQAKWQAMDKAGGFASQKMVAFHHRISQDFLKNGWLRLHRLDIEGELAAALYTFCFDGYVYDFASGMDVKFADFSPGQVLTEMSLRQAISAGIDVYDFLRGDEPYKFRWGAEACEEISMRWINTRRAQLEQAVLNTILHGWRSTKGLLPESIATSARKLKRRTS